MLNEIVSIERFSSTGFLACQAAPCASFLCSKILTTPAPPRYRPMSGTASSVCVNGSVDGVRIAAATVAPTTTKRHCLSICSEETMPVLPSSICMMGTCRMIVDPQQGLIHSCKLCTLALEAQPPASECTLSAQDCTGLFRSFSP